ncbi:MAG: HNH endonuclease [Butyrivibrio sp.]|nr:HNH endonuclease [Butyrivibrio sp.]
MKRKFRDYKITRTCEKEYSDYHLYKKYLKEDFKHRCAYCNLLDTQITTPYEVDHFVPMAAFKKDWPELETTYANLVYSCKKCNGAKSDYYKGDIKKREIKNEYFYEPEETDYGTIFYRGDDGGIYSDDEKGRDMITKLKLYRPIHNLAWICEITKTILDRLSARIEEVGIDSTKGKVLQEAKEELREYYDDCVAVFMANYNNNKFTL